MSSTIQSPAELYSLLERAGETEEYAEGDVVFAEGDPADSMYIVKSGSVSLEAGGRVLETIEAPGLFGTLSGFLANAFLAPRKPRKEEEEAAPQSDLKAKLAELNGLLDEQQQATETLRARLAEIEQLAG